MFNRQVIDMLKANGTIVFRDGKYHIHTNAVPLWNTLFKKTPGFSGGFQGPGLIETFKRKINRYAKWLAIKGNPKKLVAEFETLFNRGPLNVTVDQTFTIEEVMDEPDEEERNANHESYLEEEDLRSEESIFLHFQNNRTFLEDGRLNEISIRKWNELIKSFKGMKKMHFDETKTHERRKFFISLKQIRKKLNEEEKYRFNKMLFFGIYDEYVEQFDAKFLGAEATDEEKYRLQRAKDGFEHFDKVLFPMIPDKNDDFMSEYEEEDLNDLPFLFYININKRQQPSFKLDMIGRVNGFGPIWKLPKPNYNINPIKIERNFFF